MPPLIFLVLFLVALRCCVEIARCPPRRELRAYDAGLKRFSASLRTRHPSQLIRRHRCMRPSSFSAPTPLAMRMDLAANTMAESSLTSSSRIRRLTDLQILLRNLQRFTPPRCHIIPLFPPLTSCLALRPTVTTIRYKILIRPSQGSDRLRSDFGVRVGLLAIVKAIVVIIVGLRVVILRHVTRVSVASCRHCHAPGGR